MRITTLVFLFLGFGLTQCLEKKTPADLIIKGGTIYTVEAGNPTVEAVAVSGDTIVYAGNMAGLSQYQDEQTKVIDLAGKTMTPGFIEGHGHFMGLGYAELNPLWVWAMPN